jgi:hypothetical protein
VPGITECLKFLGKWLFFQLDQEIGDTLKGHIRFNEVRKYLTQYDEEDVILELASVGGAHVD